jgi:rubrerythrin
MTDQRAKLLAALQYAVRMEIDGQRYYTEHAALMKNIPGKRLFIQLAMEEADHRQRFESVHDTVSRTRGWPPPVKGQGLGEGIKTVFAGWVTELGLHPVAAVTELEAIQKALDMENASYELYQARCEEASDQSQKDFYAALAAEEKGHYLVLLDYHEYMTNPAFWFADKERHSLDGS